MPARLRPPFASRIPAIDAAQRVTRRQRSTHVAHGDVEIELVGCASGTGRIDRAHLASMPSSLRFLTSPPACGCQEGSKFEDPMVKAWPFGRLSVLRRRACQPASCSSWPPRSRLRSCPSCRPPAGQGLGKTPPAAGAEGSSSFSSSARAPHRPLQRRVSRRRMSCPLVGALNISVAFVHSRIEGEDQRLADAAGPGTCRGACSCASLDRGRAAALQLLADDPAVLGSR